MHTRYFQAAASPRTFRAASTPSAASSSSACRTLWTSTSSSSIATRSGSSALKESGERDDAIALGQSGPVLRASGVDWDVRRDQPYLRTTLVDLRSPSIRTAIAHDRYRVRMDEMRESTRIVAQCLDQLEQMEGEPWIADDRKVVLPPARSSTLDGVAIHHFKIVTEGYRVPEGEVYVTIESPRGECGCYVVSDGGPKPWRVKFRAPSYVALEATATCLRNSLIADMIAIVGSLDTLMGEVDR